MLLQLQSMLLWLRLFLEGTSKPGPLCMIQSQGEVETDVVDECAISDYKGPAEFDTPKCGNSQLEGIVKEFKAVFCTTPGKTNDDSSISLHSYIRVTQ